MKNQDSNPEVNRETVKSAQKKELDNVWDEYLAEEDKLADQGE